MEEDDKVELREKFRPFYLTVRKDLVVEKYSKFLWSVITSINNSDSSK